MITTTHTGAPRAVRPAQPPVVLPALAAFLRAAQKQAAALLYRYINARIAAEMNGPVRALSRRGRWQSPA